VQEVNDKYQKMMVVEKLYSIPYTQENKKDKKIVNFPLMPKSNKVKRTPACKLLFSKKKMYN